MNDLREEHNNIIARLNAVGAQIALSDSRFTMRDLQKQLNNIMEELEVNVKAQAIAMSK